MVIRGIWADLRRAYLKGLTAHAAAVVAWLLCGGALLAASDWALSYSVAHRPTGQLGARVFASPDWSGAAVARYAAATLDPGALAAAAGLAPDGAFSVEWEGFIHLVESGFYHFRGSVDDGAAMWIGDSLVFDRREGAGVHDISSRFESSQGLWPVRIRYSQLGGEVSFDVRIATPSWRDEYRQLSLLPPASPAELDRRIRKAASFPVWVGIAWSAWILAGLAIALVTAAASICGKTFLSRVPWRSLLAALVAGALLIASGVSVGTLPARGWFPDELSPKDVLYAQAQAFGSGWYHLYPPLHFYTLALVGTPFSVLDRAGYLSLAEPAVQAALHTVERLVSVTYAELLVVFVTFLGLATVGRKAARFTPWLLLTVPTFVFYGKTANVDVPYLLWTVLAWLAFLLGWQRGGLALHCALGAFVALAAATKDQAYAFFPGMAVALVWRAWNTRRDDHLVVRLLGILRSGPLWVGAAGCALSYVAAMGIPWNADGVVSHYGLIVGAGSAPFRMFEPTGEGIGALALTTVGVLAASGGPAVLLFGIAGLALALTEHRNRKLLLLMLVPVLSYAASFIAVVGYVYDRFLLGFAFIGVLFASLGLQWFASLLSRRPALGVCIPLLVVVCTSPSIAVDLKLLSDSRLEVERWMQGHLRDDPFVLGVGSQLYLPNLFPFRHRLEPRVLERDLWAMNPDVVVVNEQWLERPHQPPLPALRSALCRAGYIPEFSAPGRGKSWLRLLELGSSLPSVYSNIAKLDPPLTVWVRHGRTGEFAQPRCTADPSSSRAPMASTNARAITW